MTKEKLLKELIIKFVIFVVSFLCIIFVVKNIISMFPLFSSLKYDETTIWNYVYKTRLGTLYNSMTITDSTSILKMVKEGLYSFIKHIEWYKIIFLISFIILLILYFADPDWKMVKSYVKLMNFSIILYLLKYIVIVLGIAIFFNDSIKGVCVGLVFDTTFSMLFDLALAFIFLLFIVKFILNVYFDVKDLIEEYKKF